MTSAKQAKSKYHKIVGENFKLLRLRNNLTQKQMADTLKLKNRAYISLIESGLRSLTYENMEKIEKRFGIKAMTLFEQDEQRKIVEKHIICLAQHILNQDHLFDLLDISEPLKILCKSLKSCNHNDIESLIRLAHSSAFHD